MQANTEQLMSYQDILTMANNVALLVSELQEVKQELQQIKEAQQPKVNPNLKLKTAKDIAKHCDITEKLARRFIAMPNFPQSLSKRKLYKTGPWLASEVVRFININKNKV